MFVTSIGSDGAAGSATWNWTEPVAAAGNGAESATVHVSTVPLDGASVPPLETVVVATLAYSSVATKTLPPPQHQLNSRLGRVAVLLDQVRFRHRRRVLSRSALLNGVVDPRLLRVAHKRLRTILRAWALAVARRSGRLAVSGKLSAIRGRFRVFRPSGQLPADEVPSLVVADVESAADVRPRGAVAAAAADVLQHLNTGHAGQLPHSSSEYAASHSLTPVLIV
jgi:hypothetical protein